MMRLACCFSFVFLLFISCLSSTTWRTVAADQEEGFQQWSYLPLTPDSDGVSSIVNAGNNLVAFVYNHSLYTADGTATGTKKQVDVIYQDVLVALNQDTNTNYIYYSTGGEWKSFNPATGEVKLIHSWINGTTVYYGTPTVATKTKCFAKWRIPNYYTFYSYQPKKDLFQLENPVPDAYQVASDDVVVWNNTIVSRYDIGNFPPDTPFGGLPVRLYAAPSLNAIFFQLQQSGLGAELYKTSGDLKTVQLVADLHSGPSDSNPNFFCEVPGVGLFFFASVGDPDVITLFLYDGVSAPRRVKDFTIQFYTVIPIVRVGNRVVFIISLVDDGLTLWSSDGTEGGTVSLMPINDHYWYELASVGDLAFTVSDTDEFGWELYQTDATVEGTFKVPYETIPGPGSSDPSGLVAINGDLFFNANTPSDGVQLFKYSPERVPSHTYVIFSGEEEWEEPGGVQYTWGTSGSCYVETRSAPTNFPLYGSTIPADLEELRTFSVNVGSDYFGCGHYYPTFLDLSGAKELRFWISSTIDAKVELEVDQPCYPYTNVAGQHPCKPFIYIPSTHGEWMSYGILLNDRPAEEFARVYSPFLITAFGSGQVHITNIVYVY